MGIRVYFSYGAKNGALDHFLSAPLETFRSFLKAESKNDQAIPSGEPPLIRILDDIIERGAVALVPETFEQAQILDTVIDRFYFWCNVYEQHLEEANADALQTDGYRAVDSDIRNHFGGEVWRLWQYILNGRAVGRPENLFPYTPDDNGYPNSFWTYDEVNFLYNEMMPHCEKFAVLFGTKDYIVAAAFEAIKNAFDKEVGLIIQVA